jgi:hypothetical protein
MLIQLTADKKLKAIQEEFSKTFPYLKIEFFRDKHQEGEGSLFNKKLDISSTLIEVTGVLREGAISIVPGQTVAELEQTFQENFGLPVQVFRNSNSIWLETTETDHLTLERQNEMGKEASTQQPKVQGYYLD